MDGASALATAGVGIGEECNNILNLIPRGNGYRLLALRKVPSGMTPREFAALQRPGDPAFLGARLCAAAPPAARAADDAAPHRPSSRPCPRRGTRRRLGAAGGGGGGNAANRDVAAPQPSTVYADPLVQRIYNEDSFQPAVDGARYDPANAIGTDSLEY